MAGVRSNVMAARLLLPAALILALSLVAYAADWPEFRGPTGQGHSTETGLPLSWSESKGVAWKVRVNGSG